MTLPSKSAIERSKLVEEGFDVYELNRQMDITKSQVFMGEHSIFYGSLLSQLHLLWSTEVPTAATNNLYLWINPHWFMKLIPEVRKTVLLHELDHIAKLHSLRCGTRNPTVFNYACDIRINNDRKSQGFSFEGTRPWLDLSMDKDGRKAEEEIYDILIAKGLTKAPENGSWGVEGDTGDLPEGEPDDDMDETAVINAVTRARHQTIITGGQMPGDIELLIKQFLAPVVPWDTLLRKFMTDLTTEDYTWRRPNRRFSDIYLPSRYEDDGKLAHLMWFLDVSGSVSDAQVTRFISEVKYVWEVYKPAKMTLVQFSDRITDTCLVENQNQINWFKVTGRGGTNWDPVKKYIEDEKPTACIIFTDMGFWDPVVEPKHRVPTLFINVGSPDTPAPYGSIAYVRS